MFESVISEIITTIIGKYIVLNPQALKINLTKGRAVLNNLSLRKDALIALNLPIQIIRGSVKLLSIKISSLKSIEIGLDGVEVLCFPQKSYVFDPEEKKEKEKKRKIEEIEQFEAVADLTEGDSTIKTKLIRKVIEGLTVNVSNIHLRYEDCDEAIGVYLEKLSFFNSQDQPANIIRKEVLINHLVFYAGTTKCEDFSSPPKDDIISELPEFSAYFDFIQKHYKQVKVHMNVPTFKSKLTQKQYFAFMGVVGRLSEYAQNIKYLGIRPQVPVINNEKKWWQFAFEAFKKRKNESQKEIRKDVVEGIEDRYIALYILMKDIKKSISKKDLAELEKYDDMLQTNEILYLRKLGLKKIAQNIKKGTFKTKKKRMTKDEVDELCKVLESGNSSISANEEVISLEVVLDYGGITIVTNNGETVLTRILLVNVGFSCVVFGKGFQAQVTVEDASITEEISAHPTQLLNFAEQQIGKFYQLATHRIDEIVHYKQAVIQLDVEVVAPTITIPLFFDKDDSPCVKMLLGKFSILSQESKIIQTYKLSVENVAAFIYSSINYSNDTSYGSTIINNFTGAGVVGIGNPVGAFIDIDAEFPSFMCTLSKTKLDLIKQYITEYTMGWDEVIEPTQLEGELSLDDLEFLRQQKKMVNNLMKKAMGELFHVKLKLKEFELGVAAIGDIYEKKLITKLLVEEVVVEGVMKINGMNWSVVVGGIGIEDHVNPKPIEKYIFSTKPTNDCTCCSADFNINWDVGMIFVDSKLQFGSIALAIQPKVISEILIYGMSLLFSLSLDERTKEEKKLSLKEHLIKKKGNAIEGLSKEENAIEDLSKEEKKTSYLSEFKTNIKAKVEIVVDECSVCFATDDDNILCNGKVQGLNVNIGYDGNPTVSISLKKGNVFENDLVSGIFQPVLMYQGEELVHFEYQLNNSKIGSTKVSIHNIKLMVDSVDCFIVPSIITRAIALISSESLIKAIDVEYIHNQLIKGFGSISKNVQSSLKNIALRPRSMSKGLDLFNPSITFKSPTFRLFKDYQSGNISLNATFGIVDIKSIIDIDESVINQKVIIKFDKCNISSVQNEVKHSIVKNLFSTIGVNYQIVAAQEVGKTTSITCEVVEPLSIIVETVQLKFLIDYLFRVKNAIDLKTLMKFFDHIKDTRDKRANPLSVNKQFTKDLRRSCRKDKRYTVFVDVSIQVITFLFKDNTDVGKAEVSNISSKIRVTEDFYLECEIDVNNICLSDARKVADGRFNQLLTKSSSDPLIRLNFDMFIPSKQLTSEVIINNPTIVVIPSLIADLVLIGMNLLPKNETIKEKKESVFVRKNKPKQILYKTLIQVITGKTLNEKETCFTDDEDLIQHTGADIFHKLQNAFNLTNHETEYLCDEILRLSVIYGEYPFSFEEKYSLLFVDETSEDVVTLFSFEDKRPRETNPQNDIDKFILCCIVKGLSSVTVMDDQNLNTPYLLFKSDGNLQIILREDNTMKFVGTMSRTEWLSCRAKNGVLTYDGLLLNDNFDFSIRGDVSIQKNYIDIKTTSCFTPGTFIFSFDDIKMLIGGVMSLQKTFECITTKITQEKTKRTTPLTLSTLFENPPSFRFPFDIYLHSNFNISNLVVVVNHPTLLSPLIRFYSQLSDVKLYMYNDDIVVNTAPIITLDHYNEKFGEYEQIISPIQTDIIFRCLCDIIHGEPRMSVSLNGVFQEIKHFDIKAHGAGEYQPLCIVDQLTTDSTVSYAITAWTSKGSPLTLRPNEKVPLPIETTRQDCKECFIGVSGSTFAIPLQTTIPQIKVFQSNRVYFFSKMKYEKDGTKVVYLCSYYTKKTNLSQELQIEVAPHSSRPIPQQYIKSDVLIMIGGYQLKLNTDSLKKDSTLFVLDQKNSKAIMIEQSKIQYETRTGSCFDMLFALKYPTTITNNLPRKIFIGNGNAIELKPHENYKSFYIFKKSFRFDGEGTSLMINLRDNTHTDTDYYKLKNGQTIRVRWKNGECIIDAEFLVFNKTEETINCVVSGTKVVSQPHGGAAILSLKGSPLKLEINEGMSDPLQEEALTSGELCIIGKTAMFFVHFHVTSLAEYPASKIITIIPAYFIVNTLTSPLYLRPINTNANAIIIASGDTPKPLILSSAKKQTKVVPPEIQISYRPQGPWSNPVSCTPGSAHSITLLCSSNVEDTIDLYFTVRGYGDANCIVIEQQTITKCRHKIVNDTNEEICVLLPRTNGGVHLTIPSRTAHPIPVDNISVSAPFLNGVVEYPMTKMKWYSPIVSGNLLYFAYVYVIDGINTLTFTQDQIKIMKECPLFILGENFARESASGVEVPILSISLKAPMMSVDIIDHRRVELLYARVSDFTTAIVVNAMYADALCNVGSVQLDSNNEDVTDGVVVSIRKTHKPAIHASLQVLQSKTSSSFFYFPFITLLIQPITLNIESMFISQLYSFYTSLPLRLELSSNHDIPSSIPPYATQHQVHIQALVLQPLVLTVSFHLLPNHLVVIPYNPLTAILHALGSSLFQVSSCPLTLHASVAKHVTGSPQVILTIFIDHYYKALLRQSVLLVANSAFLGNPRGLLSDFSTGCYDFFYEPVGGLTVGVASFGRGIVGGVSSLARHSTHGISSSVGGVAKSTSSFVASFSFDSEYIQQRNAVKRAKTTGDGVRLGVASLGKGVFQGVTGIVYQPLKGAYNEGFGGFFKGVGKGMVGVVAKPVVGMVDLVGKTAEGISASTGEKPAKRMRDLRNVSDSYSLAPFSEEEARISKILREHGIGQYITHVSCTDLMWIISDKFFVVMLGNGVNTYRYHNLILSRMPHELVVKADKNVMVMPVNSNTTECQRFVEIAMKWMEYE
ncbi:Vacuolar protein sorting-associated protein [Entamoeba marina]